MLELDQLWVGVCKSNEANKKVRRLLEKSRAAEQAEIDKIQAKEARLPDLYTSGDITKQTYRARRAEYKADIDQHTEEKGKIMARMGG